MKLVEDRSSFFHRRAVVVRQANVKCFARRHGLRERAHRFFERRVRVHAVMIENVDVVKTHAHEALVEARVQIFAAAPVAVRARPHIIACFRRDDELVAVRTEIFAEQPSKILFSAAIGRPVIVREVEIRDAVVERRAHERFHLLVARRVAEVVPKTERHARQAQPTPPARGVGHSVIAMLCCFVHKMMVLSRWMVFCWMSCPIRYRARDSCLCNGYWIKWRLHSL